MGVLPLQPMPSSWTDLRRWSPPRAAAITQCNPSATGEPCGACDEGVVSGLTRGATRMNTQLILRLLRRRRVLRAREGWTRGALEAHQAASLRELRDFAVVRSPFYARRHRGLTQRALHELPVVTKGELMASFDEVVTDRALRRAEVEAHLAAMRGDELFRGRYRVAATSGSTGRRGIFLWDEDEWLWVLASYARANDWAGVASGLTRRLRLAVVSSRTPSHQSARVGASLESPWVPTLRLDASDPLPEVVARLNAFRPDALVGYASILRVLAAEQLAGRLRVTPKATMSASEVLTTETRRMLAAAFGAAPFDVYGATETSGIASECDRHRGLHLYEDLVITEVVDDQNAPVPPGAYGAKVLVTVLFSRTMPLIRYEMSDAPRLSAEPCSCGLPFALLADLEGRREDVLVLPRAGGGEVSVHPNVIHRALEPMRASGWQVVQEERGLRVLVAEPEPGFDAAALRDTLARELAGQDAVATPIAVESVASIPRTAIGKAPLIVRAPLRRVT